MTISKAEKFPEKVAMRLKKEKSKYKSLHMENKSFKDLIMKLCVNPEDKMVVEALLQNSQKEI